jgi:hypothetical protein
MRAHLSLARCSPTALAIPTGPTTFAVAAGNFVYVFDVAAVR